MAFDGHPQHPGLPVRLSQTAADSDVNTSPGMAMIEKRLLDRNWKTKVLAEPPAGSEHQRIDCGPG
ncbi:hypothetical protein [Mycobacterium sp.]|uniref:hypothetical protein n=1 Tax=Mycobacterium sp. TaxID=1785 RepID=UPI0011FB19A4|nr:hypothetical protein [Mycobacterium sp.]TAM71530.1 MAG: hypothetical protein EPN51_06505 [Mycobacterium sp.]